MSNQRFRHQLQDRLRKYIYETFQRYEKDRKSCKRLTDATWRYALKTKLFKVLSEYCYWLPEKTYPTWMDVVVPILTSYVAEKLELEVKFNDKNELENIKHIFRVAGTSALVNILDQVSMHRELMEISHLFLGVVLRERLESGFRVIRVDNSLLDIIRETYLPKEIDYPYICPNMFFIFPRGAIREFTGIDGISDFMVVFQDTNRICITFFIDDLNRFINIPVSNGKVYLEQPIVDVRYYDEAYTIHKSDFYDSYYDLSGEMRCSFLVVQMLLFMQAIPDTVERESLSFRSNRERREWECQYRMPLWLKVPNLRVLYKQACDVLEESNRVEGEKRSVVPHWRVSHWRRVRYGSGKQQVKWMFFPAVLVNKHKLAANQVN